MCLLTAESVYTQISGVGFDELAQIRKHLRFHPPNYFWAKSYTAGKWDGFVNMVSPRGYFLTGLLPYIADRLVDMGYEVEVQENYPRFKKIVQVNPDLLFETTLRDYQVRAIERMIYHQRGVVDVPTGAGKTEIMIGFVKTLRDLGLVDKVLVIVNKIGLMEQTVKRFIQRGFPPHIVGFYGNSKFKDGRVIIGIVNSVSASLGERGPNRYFGHTWCKDVDCIIYDESHHVPAQTWREIGIKIPALFRIGLSATPFKERNEKITTEEEMNLIGLTGDVIVKVPVELMVEQGFLAKPLVYFIRTDPNRVFALDWHTAYQNGVVNHLDRNTRILTLAKELYMRGHVVMIIVNHVTHGNNLMEMMKDELPLHPDLLFVYGGKQGKFYRGGELIQETIEYSKFREFVTTHSPAILIGSPAYSEGIDIPAINSLILASADKSSIQVIQKAGRGLRPKPGENVAYIFDLQDENHIYLKRNAKSRRKTYKAAGYEIVEDRDFLTQKLKIPQEVASLLS